MRNYLHAVISIREIMAMTGVLLFSALSGAVVNYPVTVTTPVITKQNDGYDVAGDQFAHQLLELSRNADPELRAKAMHKLGDYRIVNAIDMVVEALDDPAKIVREEAAWALGEYKDQRVVESIIDKINDKEPTVRVRLIMALGEIGDRQALPSLRRAIHDRVADVRWAAACSLGNIPDPASIGPLTELRYDPDPDVQLAAVNALGQMLNQGSLDALISGLSSPNALIRQHVVRNLGYSTDPRVIPIFRKALDDQDREVRIAAIMALARQRNSCDISLLLPFLQQRDPSIVKATIDGLGMIGDVRAQQALLPLAKATQQQSIREESLAIIGTIGDECAIPVLKEAVGDASAAIRLKAVVALGMIRCDEAIPPLLATLGDYDLQVRLAVIQSLQSYKTPQVEEALLPLLNDSTDAVREITAAVLGRFTSQAAQNAVLHALDDKSLRVIRAAIRSVKVQKNANAIPQLHVKLTNADAPLRLPILDALAAVGDRTVVSELCDNLHNTNPGSRYQAAQALAKVADPNAVMPLLVLLEDQYPEVRKVAIEALAAVGDTRALTPLLLIATDEQQNDAVRAGAIHAISTYDDPRVITVLASTATDANPIIRQSAIVALGQCNNPLRVSLSLDRLLTDLSLPVRIAAIETLGTDNSVTTVNALLASLNDPALRIRAAVARSLGMIAATDAAQPLMQQLSCEDEREVRAAIIEALGILRCRQAVPMLIAALKDENRQPRECAAIALRQITGLEYGDDAARWSAWLLTASQEPGVPVTLNR